MNENVKNNLEKAAEVLGWPVEQVNEKFEEVCKSNGINSQEEPLLAMGVFNTWFVQQKKRQENGGETTTMNNNNSNGPKSVFGFFVSLDEARNFSDFAIDKAVAQYRRDPQTTHTVGMVAIAVSTDNGYQLSAYVDGEEKVKNVEKLPPVAQEIEEGKWCIPLVTQKTIWDGKPNANYGRPIPKDNWSMNGHFIGNVDGGEVRHYMFRARGNTAQTFKPETFRFMHMVAMNDEQKGMLYAVDRDFQTVLSLEYNDEVTDEEKKQNTSSLNISDLVAEHMGKFMSPLIGLERHHAESLTKQYNERLVITDGSVTNINPKPTSVGNRTLFLSDLNADFDYSGESYSSTACWIPKNIDLDFGVGSHVFVVGRTSQREMDDGTMSAVSINVSGLYVINRRGQVIEINDAQEDDFDWF